MISSSIKLAEVLQKDRKHCGKWRNCLLQAISLFPTLFSKELYCRHIKTHFLSVITFQAAVNGNTWHEGPRMIMVSLNTAEMG